MRKPRLSAIGSLIAVATFLVTLSFLITTPGALSPTRPIGGFLLKDIMLLGAALYTAAEALEATRRTPPTGDDRALRRAVECELPRSTIPRESEHVVARPVGGEALQDAALQDRPPPGGGMHLCM